MKVKDIFRKIIFRSKANSQTYIKYLRNKGVRIDSEVNIWSPNHVLIDETRPFLIEIGNNVNITNGVKILTHGYDWSVLKRKNGKVYGSAGKVKIGNNVLKSFNGNSVIGGVPAKVIMSIDEYEKKREICQLDEAYEVFKEYVKTYGCEPGRSGDI